MTTTEHLDKINDRIDAVVERLLALEEKVGDTDRCRTDGSMGSTMTTPEGYVMAAIYQEPTIELPCPVCGRLGYFSDDEEEIDGCRTCAGEGWIKLPAHLGLHVAFPSKRNFRKLG